MLAPIGRFWTRACLIAAVLILIFPLAAEASEFDAFAYRAANGDPATQAEIARLEALQPKHSPAEDTAQRLARLTLAREANSRAQYEASLRRVAEARERVMRELRSIVAGTGYTTEWLNSRWLNSAMATRDELARILFRRTFADQLRITTGLDGAEERAFAYLLQVDNEQLIRENAVWLRGALEQIGWFDISRFGPEASQAAWLLVQHADFDPEWQKSMLPVLRAKVVAGDMQANYYAYLVDRVAVNAGEPQTYGTQGRCVGRQWTPFALDDADQLDSRRSAVGLENFAAYRARFTCG